MLLRNSSHVIKTSILPVCRLLVRHGLCLGSGRPLEAGGAWIRAAGSRQFVLREDCGCPVGPVDIDSFCKTP
jgi:hypothetical protein